MGTSKFAGPRIHERLTAFALLLSTVMLGACGDTQMAFLGGDVGGQSLSLVREQAYLGGPWQTTLVVAGSPRCQRRFPLGGLAANEFSLDVYHPEAAVFILNVDKRWYVTELQDCGFQLYQRPPPEPGQLVGSFQMKNNKLRYVAKASAKPTPGGATGMSASGQ